MGSISVIEHLVKQVKGSRRIDDLILATSDKENDNALAVHAEEIGLKVFRGNEDKIISRLLGAAEMCGAEIVVRLLGDCPLTDPQIIDEFVARIEEDPALDMVTNQYPHSYPDGYDVSVIRIAALRRACAMMEAGVPEHLSIMWKAENNFKFVNVEAERDYFKDYRMTLDYEKDLEAIRDVVTALGGERKILYLKDVLDYLEKNPTVVALNKEYIQ